MSEQLNSHNHDRDAAGMVYVYPVISRRAGGVSVGINLNPNNACNWHCAYCQVPTLKRGVAPEIDLQLLKRELDELLHDMLHGDFMMRRVPEGSRKLCDLAISGNGEPTSCRAFDQVVATIVDVMKGYSLAVPLRLITNGSYVGKAHVQRGLKQMAASHGEVWIKVDAVSEKDVQRINGVRVNAALLRRQVELVASLCPSWIQTCMMAWDEQPPSENEVSGYISFLSELKRDTIGIKGILLYGLARPSLQDEAARLQPLDADWMHLMAARIEAAGFEVKLAI